MRWNKGAIRLREGLAPRNGKIPMPMNSINTNAQSLIALQNLNTTNAQMSVIQKRVSTGYRVADAKDDGGAFAVAQAVRSDVAGVIAVGEQLGGVKGVLETTFASLSVVSDTMKQIRAVLTRLADAAISSDQRNTYEEQYVLLAKQVSGFIDDATYNGRTLLSTDAMDSGGDITAIRNEGGGTFTIEAVDGDVLKLDPDAFPPRPAPAAFTAGIKAQLAVDLETAQTTAVWAAKTAATQNTEIDAAFDKMTKDQLALDLEAADPTGWGTKTAAEKTTAINTAFTALTETERLGVATAQKQAKYDANVVRTAVTAELAAADPTGWAAKTDAQKFTATNTAVTALTPAQKQVRLDARIQSESLAQAQAWIQSGGAFHTVDTELSTALNKFGASMAFVDLQITYNSKKVDAMEGGLGALVDADLAKESSSLEALKVRQQLGVQTLGLANQGPQVLLGLFR
jgi:flagellin